MKKYIRSRFPAVLGFATTLVLAFLSTSTYAQTKVVVIPLGDGEPARYSQILRVALSGAQFSNVSAALNSLQGQDLSEDNRVLVKVAAGTYTVTEAVEMLEFVDVEGAGAGKTILTGSVSSGFFDQRSAIVSGANNAELRDMSVTNTGGNCWVAGMYNGNASPTVVRVTFRASGSVCQEFSTNTGVFNSGALSVPVFQEIDAKGTAPVTGSFRFVPSYGIYNFLDAIAIVEDSTLDGENQGSANGGINNEGASTASIIRGGLLLNGRNGNGLARCVGTIGPFNIELDEDCNLNI